MKMRIEDFRKKYPHLARELLDEDTGMDLELIIERMPPDPWRGYTPGVIDYLRRCKDLEEAFEVIDYLERMGELTREEAEEYRAILREKGLEAFGPPKEDNYYYKKATEYWKMLERMSKRNKG